MTNVYYLPDGTKNLSSLFPAIDWTTIAGYTVQAADGSGTVIATTPFIEIDYCLERGVRIHFINYNNSVDAINFRVQGMEHSSKSDNYQSPDVYPQDKTRHSIGRINIQAGDTFTVSTIDYPEDTLDWINELADSPVAWMEWTGVQGQPDSYLPIVISDVKIPNLKEENRYEYEIVIEFTMSNPRKPLRG